MSQVHKNSSFQKNSSFDLIDDDLQPQNKQPQYQNDYEEEFQQIDKSTEKKPVETKLSNSNSNLKDTNKKEQKTEVKHANQPPSKQNNWNQNPKKSAQIQVDQIKQHQNLNKQQPILVNQSKKLKNQIAQNSYQQKENQQNIIIQNQQPQEKSFVLLEKSSISKHIDLIESREQQKSQEAIQKLVKPQRTRQQLTKQIYENEKIIKQLKQKISNSRNEIKNIGNIVDKDIQKSIVKINNQTTRKVNIKHLFSETSQSKDGQQSKKIQQLRQDLLNIRNQSRLAKSQIISIQTKMADPVTKQNTIKYEQLENKFKMMLTQLNKKKQEKSLAQEQLKRMTQGLNLAEQEIFDKSILRNQQNLSKLATQIKDQRAKLYRLQKQDIQLMEKLKFLTEKDQKQQNTMIQSEKSLGQEKMTQEEIKSEIKSLVDDINSFFEEKRKIQTEKVRLLKFLQTQIQEAQAKNMSVLNQIRGIDSSLLQFYTQKVQKKNSSLAKQMPKTAQKLHETIDSGSPLLRQKNIETSYQNDKNISSSTSSNKFRSKIKVKKESVKDRSQFSQIQVDLNDEQENVNHEKKQFIKKQRKASLQNVPSQMIETKVQLNFGDLKVDEKGAILSDEILGKVKIKEINLFVDKKHCYGVYCKYFNEEKPQIFGMKICEKNADEKCQKITLILNQKSNQALSQVKVGYSLRNQIKLIQITTSLSNNLKWNVQNEVTKIDTKTIDLYSSISIKAKLVNVQEMPSTTKSLNQLMNQKPKLKIAGIGFSVNELKNSN